MWQLVLDDCQLTGPIPEALGACAALRELWLSSNQLVGVIPEALGACTELEKLVLASNNGLNGPVPEALRKRQQEGSLDMPTVGTGVTLA